jgi:hypothetical protein
MNNVVTLRDDARIEKRNERFPDLPEHMRGLPVDHRGFPVPWFVPWVDGEPHFPAADARKFTEATKHGKCWVCGGTMGKFRAAVIGPMCALNRTIAEPQSHVECARFSARRCPFLANPRMGRVPDHKQPDDVRDPPGVALRRNPGACAVWIERQPSMQFYTGNGFLFKLGEPDAVEWYANGREAFREEVLMSIKTGLPALMELAVQDPDPEGAFRELGTRMRELVPLIPKKSGPGVASCMRCQKQTDDLAIIECTSEECPLFPDEPVC